MKTIYTSDRGDAYNVATMETSHLINVITHHLQQRKTLQTLTRSSRASSVNIQQRYDLLSRVIDHLADELAEREVMGDEYLSLAPAQGQGRSDSDA